LQEHKRKHGTVAKKEEGEKAHILIYYIVRKQESTVLRGYCAGKQGWYDKSRVAEGNPA